MLYCEVLYEKEVLELFWMKETYEERTKLLGSVRGKICKQ
jgi:hypothetical protein